MRILLAGGGSGGHVTPLRAISESLKTQTTKELQMTVITDRRFYGQTKFLFEAQPEIKIRKVTSGKYRRYNNKSVVWHITHLPTILKNIRDVVLILLGIVQSIHYFLWNKPDVVFCKGGYVCVPIGIAAHLFKVPLIIHDSDTHAGLTNRFLSRWATKIGTGMPAQYYSYPKEKMVYSGIPVADGFKPVTPEQQYKAKQKIGLDPKLPLLFVTGGGTGAQELNRLTVELSTQLLDDGWQIIQITGKDKAKEAQDARHKLKPELSDRWIIEEFAELQPLILASDIIVSRAGATAMQEFANAAKPVILVPNPYLTGGHQLKNAQMFAEKQAGQVLQEDDLIEQPQLLLTAVRDLLKQPAVSQKLATNLFKEFAKPTAAEEIAKIVLTSVSKPLG